MAFAVVIIAVLIAAMLPFFFWSIVTMKKGIQDTRTEIEESSSTVQKSISAQSGNVQDLVSTQERLIERIKHLEAIVTSEAWDSMAKEKQAIVAQNLLEIDEPPITDEERSASMARRLENE